MSVRLVIPLALLCAACGVNAEEDARNMAVSDFHCPDVVMTTMTDYECANKRGCWGEYLAVGCYQKAHYECSGNESSDSCEEVGYATQSSTVTINGVLLVPDGVNGCRSGEGEGEVFFGVDLSAPSGDTLRIVQNSDLSYTIVALTASGDVSPPLQNCAIAHMTNNDGLTGDAVINCAAPGWTVIGSVTFNGCSY